MKKIMLVAMMLLISSISLYCQEVKTDFSFEGNPLDAVGKKFALNAGLGMVNYKNAQGQSESLPKLQLQPTLRLGPITTGLDVELLIASKDKKKIIQDSGKNPVIVRFVEYNKDPLSARWGTLERITLGRGLIMNNYSSATSAKSSVFTNKDKGVKVSYKKDEYGITALATPSHIYGVRGYYKAAPKLTVGGTVVMDGDKKDDISAYGLDITVPLMSKVDFYTEVATLKIEDENKSGFTSGVYLNLIENKLGWKNEFRNFADGFVPGYFDAHYETYSLFGGRTQAPQSKNGFLSRIDIALIEQVKMFAAYEKYKNAEPRLVAEAQIDLTNLSGEGGKSPLPPVKGIISYQQENFRVKDDPNKNAIIKGTLSVGLQKNIDLVVGYLRTYDLLQDKPITSTTYNVKYKF